MVGLTSVETSRLFGRKYGLLVYDLTGIGIFKSGKEILAPSKCG